MIALRSRSLADMSLNDMIIFLAVNIFYSFVFYKFTVGALEKDKTILIYSALFKIEYHQSEKLN